MKHDIEVTNDYTAMLIDVTTEFSENGFLFCQVNNEFKAKHCHDESDEWYKFNSIFEAHHFLAGFNLCSVINGLDSPKAE